jgi:hypothetical protein
MIMRRTPAVDGTKSGLHEAGYGSERLHPRSMLKPRGWRKRRSGVEIAGTKCALPEAIR